MSFKSTLIRLTPNLKATTTWYKDNLEAKISKPNQLSIGLENIEKAFSTNIKSISEVHIGDQSFICAEAQYFDTSIQYPKPNSLDFQHLAIIVRDIENVFEKLKKQNVKIVSSSPQTIPLKNTTAGGITVLYLYDGNGFSLALVEYPIDKGKTKWHNNLNLIKGIDHSAIVVSSLSKSTAWYTEHGYHIDVEDQRYGVEQDNLTGVPESRVSLVGFEGSESYGTEIIEYTSPKSQNIKDGVRQQMLIISNHQSNITGLHKDPSGHYVYFC